MAVSRLPEHNPSQHLINLTSIPRSFKALSPQTRMLVGLGILAWGSIGLYVSDAAEKKFGLEPSEKDKEALEAVTPRIIVVDREEGR